MTDSFQELQGLTVAGRYRLEEWLAEEDGAAFFRASFGGTRVIVELRRDSPGDLWQRAATLHHPNLQRILDDGRADGLHYAVYEYPDDCLASAAASGLTPKEARDVINAVRLALEYVHARGLAHGAVDDRHIVAVGDTIKLESAPLHHASPAERAEDLRDLEDLAATLGVTVDSPYRKWAIVAAAVFAVTLVAVLARHTSAPAPSRPSVYSSTIPASTPPSPAPAPSVRPSGNWRVIVYTFSRYKAAAVKVDRINHKHPGLHAEVFMPKGPRTGPFLVALGGRTTRAEAERLERRAKAEGLPRDTFARNYAN